MPAARSVEPASPPRRRFITINDAAEYLCVTERTIRLMISDGRLVGYRLNDRFIRFGPRRDQRRHAAVRRARHQRQRGPLMRPDSTVPRYWEPGHRLI